MEAADVAGRREGEPLAELETGQVVDEPPDAEELPQLLLESGPLLVDRCARLRAGRANGVVESRDADVPVRRTDARERGVQPPGGARQDACKPRVGVVAQRLDVELDEEIALEPEPDLGTAVEREAAALP